MAVDMNRHDALRLDEKKIGAIYYVKSGLVLQRLDPGSPPSRRPQAVPGFSSFSGAFTVPPAASISELQDHSGPAHPILLVAIDPTLNSAFYVRSSGTLPKVFPAILSGRLFPWTREHTALAPNTLPVFRADSPLQKRGGGGSYLQVTHIHQATPVLEKHQGALPPHPAMFFEVGPNYQPLASPGTVERVFESHENFWGVPRDILAGFGGGDMGGSKGGPAELQLDGGGEAEPAGAGGQGGGVKGLKKHKSWASMMSGVAEKEEGDAGGAGTGAGAR